MISTNKLVKSFDGVKILDNLNIHIETGSIYGLAGRNGSGKTTLLRLLSGILRADSGEVLFDGSPIYENPEIKAKIGFISDDMNFLSQYTMDSFAKLLSGIYPNWNKERFETL